MGIGNGWLGGTPRSGSTPAGGGSGFDIDLYHADTLDDELGEGLRLYTLDDTVYEARTRTMSLPPEAGETTSRIDTRIYMEEGDWMLKANTPVTEKKPAYHALRAFADTAEEERGVELETTWLDYQTTYEDGSAFEVQDDGITVSLRQEGMLEIPTVSHDMEFILGSAVGGGIGACAAAVSGMFGMPVDLFSGYFLGYSLGAGVGAVGPKAQQFRTNRKRREKYGTVDGMEEFEVFDRINEQNRLEQVLNRPGPAPDHFTEAYNDLRKDEFEEVFDIVTTAHFEEFHEQAGVTLTGRFDTYGEAYDMAAALTGVEAEAERPSIYTDPAAFQHLFSFLTYREDGEDHLLSDGETLIETVMQRDVDDAIAAWLDEEHADLVRDVARQHSLEGETDG